MVHNMSTETSTSDLPATADESLLPELVAYLRENRTGLREQWVDRITAAGLLTAMSPEEIFSEVTAVYDNYVAALETGSVETLQAYALRRGRGLSPGPATLR